MNDASPASSDALPFRRVEEQHATDAPEPPGAGQSVEIRTDRWVIRRAKEISSGRVVGIQQPTRALLSDPTLAPTVAEGARLAARLFHPHLLAVLDVAQDEAGPYAIVEWPEGGSLAAKAASGEMLESTELVRVARAVGSALVYLEKKGLAHGAVCADSIVALQGGALKLAGWILPSDDAGEVMRADVHRLSVLLFRLATGKDTVEENRWRLPRWLDKVLLRGMAVDPARRFARAQDFVEMLVRNLEKHQPREEPRERESPERAETAAPAEAFVASRIRALAAGAEVTQATFDDEAIAPRSGALDRRSGRVEFPFRPLEEQYRLIGSPLSGGMGSVFKALELATGRTVAIKRLRPACLGDEQAARRFRVEAFSIAQLNHPNVLQLHQVGRDRLGDYLVLEWAPGGSLMDLIEKRGRLPASQVRHVATSIGGALAYAHSKGCIHRDVKPHNILLGETGEPKLADFGLARTGEERAPGGATGGSPNYMAPEQCQDAQRVDARSDLYAFAKTLVHLLTGVKPVHVRERDLPREWRRPLMRALREDPQRRFASIEAFVAALEAARRTWRTRLLVAAGLAALAAIVALVYSLGGGEPQAPSVAVDPPAVERPAPAPTVKPPDESAPPAPGPAAVAEPPPVAPAVDPLGVDVEKVVDALSRLERNGVLSHAKFDESKRQLDAWQLESRTRPDDARRAELESTEHLMRREIAGRALEHLQESLAPWRGTRLTTASDFAALRALTPFVAAAGSAEAAVPEAGEVLAFAALELAWADAIESIADPARSPRYHGRAIAQQDRLAPLGQNPATGLHEFWRTDLGTKPARRADGSLAIDAGSAPVFVLIPAGSYPLGAQAENDRLALYDPEADADERGSHDATLDPFFVARCELTRAQWRMLGGVAPEDEPLLPIGDVDHATATEVLARAGLTLPTEAQWEVCCRAEGKTRFGFGDDAARFVRFANLADASAARSGAPVECESEDDGCAGLAPIARFEPNAYGLYDMHGNVAEWCLDAHVDYARFAPRAGDGLRRAEGDARIARGGSYLTRARDARTAARFAYPPGYAYPDLGVRPVQRVEP